MNIQYPLIIVIVKHVLRNNHYRNTVLVFTPEITDTLKVLSATFLSQPLSHFVSDLGHKQTGVSQ